jgi:hypothetical protein
MFKAIYDYLVRHVLLCSGTDELPENARMLLQLRPRLEAILIPYAAGRRLRLHGMSAVDLNGAVVEVEYGLMEGWLSGLLKQILQ